MKKIFSICFIIILLFIILSCAASLPPNTFIRSQYFSIATPVEKDWDEIKGNDLENKEFICLQKGHGPGNLSESDYPIKTLIIHRRKIQDDTDDIELLKARLYKNAQSDIKMFVGDLSQRFFLDDFQCHPIKSKDKLIYHFTYNVSIHFDSLDPDTPPIPNFDKEKIPLGNGIGQYYIYFPKFYKEWNSYYLFIYDEYPLEYSSENNIGISKKEEITKDSNKSSSEIDTVIKFKLTDFIKGFSCVEDSLKK
jgi:hypothetical protein